MNFPINVLNRFEKASSFSSNSVTSAVWSAANPAKDSETSPSISLLSSSIWVLTAWILCVP